MPFLLAERAREECARSMRAVKGSLGHSPKERTEKWQGSHWTRVVGGHLVRPQWRK